MNNHKIHHTSSFANWLATRLLDEFYVEEFFGDLEEVYLERVDSKNRLYAKFMYWVDLIHLLIGFSKIRLFKTQNNNTMMIKNMFKIAWRSAMRQKQFTVLNLLGLTIGIACCLIIGLYVYDETTYDAFHEKSDRIYRVNQPMIWNDWNIKFASTGPNVAVALRQDVPEFEEVTRLLTLGPRTARKLEESKHGSMFKEENLFIAEENFFEVFSFEFLQGNPRTALSEPMSMVITQETAERYFGFEDALGKSIEIKSRDGSWKPYNITGVLSDIPEKSHLQFDLLVSLSSYQKMMQANEWKWIWTAFSTYGLVREGTDIEALTNKIQAIPPKWAPPTTERIFNQSYEEYTASRPWTLYLQPLKDVYLDRQPGHHRFGPNGNEQFVGIFGAIGVLVLLLSSINFMNLSTARSTNRAKEVGIRKVLGSQRKTLIKQFVFESVLFVTASTVAALILVQFSLSSFNELTEKNLSLMTYLTNPLFIGLLISFVLLLGIIAGSYPAFYLSSFKPIETLKGKTSAGFKGKGIRNGLVVVQFSISIALIICTLFVQKQLTYTTSLDLGLAKDNVLQLHNIEELGPRAETLKKQLSNHPAFSIVGKSFALPPNIWDGERYKTSNPDIGIVDMSNFRADGDYVDLLRVEFLAGRNFDPAIASDKYGVILNEKAVSLLGWGSKDTYNTDSPIGKSLICAFDNEEALKVIGVVKDFNFHTTRHTIAPLAIIHYKDERIWNYGLGASYLSLRINSEVVRTSEELQALIENVEGQVAQLDSSILFEYSFMDTEFENAFLFEQRMGVVLNLFTLMALTIACLGLFGLAAFSAEQRIKELSIRKVLGAKVSELLVVFSSEFTRLILISILIATPTAYYLTDYWLNDFPYRTTIDPWVFVVAALSAIVIALATISYQSLKAAYKNPAETLKDE